MAGGIGLAGLLLVGCLGGGIYYLSSDGDDESGTVVDGGSGTNGGGGLFGGGDGSGDGIGLPTIGSDGWERKIVPGTVLSVEVPKAKPGAARKGQNPYPGLGVSGLYVEQEGPNGTIKFLAGPSLANEPKPAASLERQVRGSNELGPGGQIKRSFTRRGLSMVIATGRDWTGEGNQGSIILFVRVESGLVISFTVIGDGLDETHPDVKRFFDSVRIGR